MNVRRLAIGLLLLGTLVGGWFVWDAYHTPKPPPLPDIALEGVEQETADAVQRALEAVRQKPQSGPAWGKLGMVLQANGFNEHVSRCYEEAERLEPNNCTWPYLHGIHFLESNPSQGIALLRKVLTMNLNLEEQAATHYRLAIVLIEDGQLDLGEEHLNALRQIDAKDPRVRFADGVLALARGDRDRAREDFKTLTENPFIQKRASNLLATLVNEEQSQILKNRAGRMPADPPWPDPLEERMRNCKADWLSRFRPIQEMQAQGRHEDALNYLIALAAESPDREVYYVLGVEHMKRSEYEAAEAALRTAIHLESTNAKSHLLLALSLLHQGDLKQQASEASPTGIEFFRKSLIAVDGALALQRESSDALLVRGMALRRLGRTDEAIRSLRQAVTTKPDSADTYLELGITLLAAGEEEEGIQQLKIAVQFAAPDNPRPSSELQKWQQKSKSLPKGK